MGELGPLRIHMDLTSFSVKERQNGGSGPPRRNRSSGFSFTGGIPVAPFFPLVFLFSVFFFPEMAVPVLVSRGNGLWWPLEFELDSENLADRACSSGTRVGGLYAHIHSFFPFACLHLSGKFYASASFLRLYTTSAAVACQTKHSDCVNIP